MLYGIAGLNVGTNNFGATSLIGENIAFPQCVAGFAMTANSNFSEAKCYTDGILQTVASAINAEDFMIDLTYEFLDWTTLQLLYGELATSGGAVVPTSKSASITQVATPLATPDITAANAASVKVYDQTKGVFLTLAATSATVNADEFFVDGTASTIKFNASQTGSTVSYRYDKIYTNIQSIGAGQAGQAYDALSDLNMTAVVSSAVEGAQAYALVLPKVARTNTPSLQIQGDKAVIQIQYKALVPPGSRKPFRLYRLNGAV